MNTDALYSHNKKKHLGETLTGDSHAAAVMSTVSAPGPDRRNSDEQTRRTTWYTRAKADSADVSPQSPLLKDSVLGAQQAAAHLMPTPGPGRPNAGPCSHTGAGGPGGVPTSLLFCARLVRRLPTLPHKAFEENVAEKLREVGGGFGWGTHTPAADSCRCMAKTTTILWSN